MQSQNKLVYSTEQWADYNFFSIENKYCTEDRQPSDLRELILPWSDGFVLYFVIVQGEKEILISFHICNQRHKID